MKEKCQECGAPSTWGSDSPDDRLDTGYCDAHVPAWLKAAYYRQGIPLPGFPSPKRSG